MSSCLFVVLLIICSCVLLSWYCLFYGKMFRIFFYFPVVIYVFLFLAIFYKIFFFSISMHQCIAQFQCFLTQTRRGHLAAFSLPCQSHSKPPSYQLELHSQCRHHRGVSQHYTERCRHRGQPKTKVTSPAVGPSPEVWNFITVSQCTLRWPGNSYFSMNFH